jgi:hypothetical protein
MRADIKILAGIGGHRFLLGASADGAGDERLKDDLLFH